MKIKWTLVYVYLFSLTFGQGVKKEPISNPKKAFYFSFIPGLGQAYNKKWVKSFAMVGSEVVFFQLWRKNIDNYNNYDLDNYPLKKHRYLEKRNKYAWWIGILYIYGMIDSIVDAHLYEFKNLMETPIDENYTEEEKDE